MQRARNIVISLLCASLSLLALRLHAKGTTPKSDNPKKVEKESAKQALPASEPTSNPAKAVIAYPGIPLDPNWPKEVYVMTDSVFLGAKNTFIKSIPDWTVTFDGRPALMIKKASKEIAAQYTELPPVAIVALGYNSLWEKNRKNYKTWAARFDKEAEGMIKILEERGVKKIVWVTLRESEPKIVPKKAMWQYEKYAWYFPYVNERLRALTEKHPNLALADWSGASQKLGFTYDAIHLNPKGSKAIVETIKAAIGL